MFLIFFNGKTNRMSNCLNYSFCDVPKLEEVPLYQVLSIVSSLTCKTIDNGSLLVSKNRMSSIQISRAYVKSRTEHQDLEILYFVSGFYTKSLQKCERRRKIKKLLRYKMKTKIFMCE